MSQELFAALGRLDSLLQSAIARAEAAYGPGTMADSFRGLHIDLAEAERLLARAPGQPLLCTDRPEGLPPLAGPLAALAQEFDLSPFDLDVIVIALAPELDLRYERLYAYLQDDVTKKRPTVDLALNLLCPSADDKLARRAHFQADAPLLRSGILRLCSDPSQPEPPLLAQSLRLDDQIGRLLIGGDGLDARLAAFCALVEPDAAAAPHPLPEELSQVLEALAKAAATGTTLRLYLRGPAGTGRRRVAELAAARTGKRLLAADLVRAPDGPLFGEGIRVLFREAAFKDAICFLDGLDPLLAGDRAPDQLVFARELVAASGVVVLAGSAPWPSLRALGADAPLAVVVVSCPVPPVTQRRQEWRAKLDRAGIDITDGDLDTLARRFKLTPAQIAEAAATAPRLGPPGAPAGLAEIFAAARAQTGHELGGLAVKIEPVFEWGDIVLPDDSLLQLREICQRVAHQERVLEEWGFGRKLPLGRGVSALFAGPPGTGKTMAAEIVARALGLDLYRIDLSGVVSKWIGETEKNLDRIFRAAENANAILFFDEADALFGKRSEVRDSHDRYANIEISYLLQKMETYEGVAILATNRIEDLDEAFLRRLGFVVRFPFPEEPDRLRIWAAVWPDGVQLANDLDWSMLARELSFSGAEIRNVALAAAFFAAEARAPVTLDRIVHAARREYEKAGKSFGEPELTRFGGPE
jgi:ATPase family associated with various cellular activities (AAA)